MNILKYFWFFFNWEWTWYSEHHKSFRSGTIQMNACHWEQLLGCTKKCFVWGIYGNQGGVMLMDLCERICERKFICFKICWFSPGAATWWWALNVIWRLLQSVWKICTNIPRCTMFLLLMVVVTMWETLEIHCHRRKGRGVSRETSKCWLNKKWQMYYFQKWNLDDLYSPKSSFTSTPSSERCEQRRESEAGGCVGREAGEVGMEKAVRGEELHLLIKLHLPYLQTDGFFSTAGLQRVFQMCHGLCTRKQET